MGINAEDPGTNAILVNGAALILGNLTAASINGQTNFVGPAGHGPASQDFMAAFRLGEYDKGINTLDTDGVTFAAIRGLVEEIWLRDEKIAQLEALSREQGEESRRQIETLKEGLRAIREQLSELPPR